MATGTKTTHYNAARNDSDERKCGVRARLYCIKSQLRGVRDVLVGISRQYSSEKDG